MDKLSISALNFNFLFKLKEKLLAAHRAGIKEVLIPKENEKDLVDMPKKIIDDIKITPVEHADEVLKIALTKELKRVEWVEVEKISKSEAGISGYSAIKFVLEGLKTTLMDIKDQSDFASLTTRNSQTSAVSVTASSSASAGRCPAR